MAESVSVETEEEKLVALQAIETYRALKQGVKDALHGSGAIEGACKKIGSSLKINSACWRVQRAERFGALLCLEYADQSASYLASKAA